MKGVFALALFAGAIAVGDAACLNHCSGRGTCGNYKPGYTNEGSTVNHQVSPTFAPTSGVSTTVKKDTCVCHTYNDNGALTFAFFGPDCSQHTCPHGVLHAGNDHTIIEECSGMGSCDRSTGQCKCQTGFSGSACQRRTCDRNDCSNRGRCISTDDYTALVNAKNTADEFDFDLGSYTYTAHDRTSNYGCLCDPGYRGYDCSIKECPSSADIMGGKGSESGRTCSGRGTCDATTGTCKCAQGYYGKACNQQYSQSSSS